MKTNTQAFPYPILTYKSDEHTDYRSSIFIAKLKFGKEISTNSDYSICYEFENTNDEINQLIERGAACFAIELRCSETLERTIYNCNIQGEITVNGNDLYGQVEFTPIIVMKEEVKGFTSTDLNYEFGDSKFNLYNGDIIAFDKTKIKAFRYDDANLSSYILKKVIKELDEFTYSIELEKELIYINMDPKMFELFEKADKSIHSSALGMSIYKDVVYLAIEEVYKGNHKNSPWALKLRSTIEEKGFKKDRSDFNHINILAQKIVSEFGVGNLHKQTSLVDS